MFDVLKYQKNKQKSIIFTYMNAYTEYCGSINVLYFGSDAACDLQNS